MGKKKKKDINGAPLQSITIGKIKKSRFGLLKVIILFSLFTGVIYYMPEIQNLCNKYFPNNIFNVDKNLPNNDKSITNTTTSNDDKSTDDIKYDNLTFNNIAYDNGTLSFKVNNDGNINIDMKDVYFCAYKDDSIVKCLYVDDIIAAKENKSFSYNVNLDYDKFDVVKVDDSFYPNVTMSGESILCKNGYDTYEYIFNNTKLFEVKYSLNVPHDAPNYSEIYDKYSKLNRSLKNNEGIDTKLRTQSGDIFYDLDVNYSVYNGELLNDLFLFSKEDDMKKISFIMNSRLYNCS